MSTTPLKASATGNLDLPVPRGRFDGVPNTDVRVQFYGMLSSCRSIDNVCTQFGRALLQHIDAVGLHPYLGTDFFDDSLAAAASLNRAAPIGIFFGVPTFVPDFFFDHPTTIGGFVCETDRIPPAWVDVCNRFDLILVPSRFCRDTFAHSGVGVPIGIVPHGVEPEYRPRPGRRPVSPFRFYNTMNSNAPERKGLPELVRAFVRAFPDRDDVRLCLRVNDVGPMTQVIAGHAGRPEIEIEAVDNGSTESFAARYSEVHCTVHPSRGEGFGLIPFQSIACETPVIAARHTGMADYVTANNALVLRTRGTIEGKGVYYQTGSYSAIDEDHLVELMRYVVDHYDTELARVRRIGGAFREAYAWERVLAPSMSLIEELSRVRDPGQHPAIIARHIDRLRPVPAL